MALLLKCPVCGMPLERDENSFYCENRHCYDCAKSGYVNLLQSNTSSEKRHGDDKLMLISRRNFLEKGYFSILCKAIVSEIADCSFGSIDLCDVGCGEGWYLEQIINSPLISGKSLSAYALDISKSACEMTAKRLKTVTAVVAGMNRLPFSDGSLNVITSIFAPLDYNESARVLKNDGVIIKAIPLQKHLMSLKEKVYDKAYENKVELSCPDGFIMSDYKEIKSTAVLGNNELTDLFKMTPYYYKTSRREQEKLLNTEKLEVQFEFGIIKYSVR